MLANFRTLAGQARVLALCAAMVLANTWGLLHHSAHGEASKSPPGCEYGHSVDHGHAQVHADGHPRDHSDHHPHDHSHGLTAAIDAWFGHTAHDESCAQSDTGKPGTAATPHSRAASLGFAAQAPSTFAAANDTTAPHRRPPPRGPPAATT